MELHICSFDILNKKYIYFKVIDISGVVKIKRKVVKHGPSSLIVSLPVDWVRKYGIKQGDELDVNNEGGRLVINSKNEMVMPEVNLDVSNFSHKLIDKFLIGMYQRGYDKIRIQYNDKKQLKVIQKGMPEFLGFEIMERTNQGCLIESIAKNLDIDFHMALRRAFLIVKDMADTTLKAYEGKDKETLKHIYFKDYDVNKFCYYCLRTINKQTYIGSSEGSSVLYFLIEMLENLGDSYKKLSKTLVGVEKDKEIVLILRKINEYLNLAYEFFYKPDRNKIVDALRTDQEIIKLIKIATRQSIRHNKLQKMYILFLLREMVQIIYHFPSRKLGTLGWVSRKA